jgi:hypothetical protein
MPPTVTAAPACQAASPSARAIGPISEHQRLEAEACRRGGDGLRARGIGGDIHGLTIIDNDSYLNMTTTLPRKAGGMTMGTRIVMERPT